MAKETIVPSQGLRERHLNIVYFIDSSKSHSIRIHLALARWIFALLIGITLWSVLSIGWIISLGSILANTRDQLSETLASVFAYQVKYDKVFDLAYPDESNAVANTKQEPPPLDDPSATKISSALSELPNVSETSTKNKVESKQNATEPAKDNRPANQDSKIDIDIRNERLSAADGTMTLTFDITNKDPVKKAQGYIWAIASIELPEGKIKTIVAPEHARIQSADTTEGYQSTYKFSIQKFKKKDFTFAAPPGDSWKVKEVIVTYVDTLGSNTQTKKISAPLKIANKAPTLETP